MNKLLLWSYIIEICRHTSSGKNVNNSKKNRRSQKRHSAPPATNQSKKNRFRSPFQPPITTEEAAAVVVPPPPPENGTNGNGNQSDEYEIPKKVETNILKIRIISCFI